MFCPECGSEYRAGFTECSDCGVGLVRELTPNTRSEYVSYKRLYSPSSPSELAIVKSILSGSEINYYVVNDNFGSLYVGPQIALYNNRIIMVQDDQHDKASELLADYLEHTDNNEEFAAESYSTFDKIRLFFEFLLFGWIMPGKKKLK